MARDTFFPGTDLVGYLHRVVRSGESGPIRRWSTIGTWRSPDNAYSEVTDWLYYNGRPGDFVEIKEQPGEFLWFVLTRQEDGVYDDVTGAKVG